MRTVALAACFGICATAAAAQDFQPLPEMIRPPTPQYSPYVDQNFPQNVYFGDTHLHSSWSTDAGMAGATLGPEEAYRFARGEEVTSHLGLRVKLIRPLDFIVLADHAENFGLADLIRNSDPTVLASPVGKRWHDMAKAGKGYDAFIEWLRGTSEGKDQINNPAMARTAWERATANADRYYDPGVFTAFIGFEWTSQPGGNNIHRVVIVRDNADRANAVVPFSAYDSEDPEDLWAYLDAYEAETHGRALAIPHNGNLSNGTMFDDVRPSGDPLTAEYASKRIAREPLMEVTQAKGTGEAHPLLSPEDEFADHELLDAGNITGSAAKTPEMLPKEYARPALKRGLAMEKELGVNPYKFGMVGSTDNHTALATTREENWFGKAHIVEPSPVRYKDVLIKAQSDPSLDIMATDLSASGLAAVWARENTREAIFDAMVRKEVYATTGTRMRVRVFGGWDFAADDVLRPDFAEEGYARGVPMGGDLSAAPEGSTPKFMVRALRDPDGANLDRIQIVKGWMDAAGELHEKIYDIACADGRAIDERNRCNAPVGDTVDVENATYANSIGDAVLAAYWQDPDFDPIERAFYYVRVIEIPTPRWTAFDAKFFDITMPEGIRMKLEERAYTSPIWYTPEG